MPDERPGQPAAADVYKGFIDAVNRKDLDAAERFVDPEPYRENCVGFTHGFIRWDASKESIRQVWKGIPDLHVELPQILADDSVVLAHGTVTGTATGRLYGAPRPSEATRPTSSTSSASMTAGSSSGSSRPTCSARCASSTARDWGRSGWRRCSGAC